MNQIPVAHNASETVIGQIEFLMKQKRGGTASTGGPGPGRPLPAK